MEGYVEENHALERYMHGGRSFYSMEGKKVKGHTVKGIHGGGSYH